MKTYHIEIPETCYVAAARYAREHGFSVKGFFIQAANYAVQMDAAPNWIAAFKAQPTGSRPVHHDLAADVERAGEKAEHMPVDLNVSDLLRECPNE